MKTILLLVMISLPATAFAQYTTGGVVYAATGSTLTSTGVPPSGDLLVGTGTGPAWVSSLSTLCVGGTMGIAATPQSNVGLLMYSSFSGNNNLGILAAPVFTYTGNSQYNISLRSESASLVTGTYSGIGYYNLHLETPYSVTGSKLGTSVQLYIDQGAGFTNSWGIYQAGTDPNYLSGELLVNGNVGIGTIDPAYPLSVHGTIEATEVIVQTGWSDYVFSKDYHVEPLTEVASQIKKEGRLPGMPSAKEVAEHGAKIGEIQKLLLAKIEELTLHAIEQEKRLDDEVVRIDRLESENQRLRGGTNP